MYGKVSKKQLEQLVDLDAKALNFAEAKGHIEEGMTQFPAEDCLQGIKDRMVALSRCMSKSANRNELLSIIEALGTVEQELQQASEYGKEKCGEALKEMEKVG